MTTANLQSEQTCGYGGCSDPAAVTLDGYQLCRFHRQTHAEDFDPLALDRADRAERTVTTAMRLVAAVHGWRAGDVERLVTHADLSALVVVLAGMVDPAADRQQLLEWSQRPMRAEPGPGDCAKPSRYRWAQHRKAGEPPCDACELVERTYQHDYHQKQLRRRDARPLRMVAS